MQNSNSRKVNKGEGKTISGLTCWEDFWTVNLRGAKILGSRVQIISSILS